MDKVKVGLLGSTGLVGQVFVKLLDKHPWFSLEVLSASPGNAGRKYGDAVHWIMDTPLSRETSEKKLVPAEPEYFKDVDIVFSALPSSVAGEVEARFARSGLVVVSNARPFRLDPDVPLLIPEINWDHIRLAERQSGTRGYEGRIVKNPNCSTAILSLSLKPLLDIFGLKRVTVTTLQALSGAGYRGGVPSLDILDNVLPYIKGEEEKLESEPLKILGRLSGGRVEPAGFKVNATATRVPTLHGHLESVTVETAEKPTGEEELVEAWKGYRWPGEIKRLPTAPSDPVIVRAEDDRPQPRLDRDSGNGMSVVVGRVKIKEPGVARYLVLGHNLVRGAAGNAVLIGELYAKHYGLL